MKNLIPFVLLPLQIAIAPLLMAPLLMTQAAMASAPEGANALPAVWNGNLCEPDAIRLCLGVQGKSRDAWVNCMRDHYSQLTANCQEVMSPKNFKAPADTAQAADVHAANSAAGY